MGAEWEGGGIGSGGEPLRVAGPNAGKVQGSLGRRDAKGEILRRKRRFL